ncbi:hypothetical protein LLH03_12740 [bacterium]|nr:hypothetical protein [bacterium]
MPKYLPFLFVWMALLTLGAWASLSPASDTTAVTPSEPAEPAPSSSLSQGSASAPQVDAEKAKTLDDELAEPAVTIDEEALAAELEQERAQSLSEKRQEYGITQPEEEASDLGLRRRYDPEGRCWRFEQRDEQGQWSPLWPEAEAESQGLKPALPRGMPSARWRDTPGLGIYPWRSLQERGLGRFRAPGVRTLPRLRPWRDFEYHGPWPWEREEKSPDTSHRSIGVPSSPLLEPPASSVRSAPDMQA